MAVVFLCVCASFVVGFLVRGNEALLERLGFDSLVVSAENNPGQTVTGNTYDSISARVAEVEGVVDSDSLDTYDLNDATKRVLDSFVASTADPYLTTTTKTAMPPICKRPRAAIRASACSSANTGDSATRSRSFPAPLRKRQAFR